MQFKASYQALSQENALNLEKYNELKEQRGQEEVSQQTVNIIKGLWKNY